MTGINDNLTYRYDANGNMIAVYDTAKNYNRVLYWDDDNRLVKTVDTTNGRSVATTYQYDIKGMRMLRQAQQPVLRHQEDIPPYKFTGKELDPETGLYYFGARYYDARLSRWISTDPALQEGKYFPKPNDYETTHDYYWYHGNIAISSLPGMGGIFRSVNLTCYHYAGNNPVVMIDPDGNEDIIFVKNSKAAYKKFESIALVYEDGTFDKVRLGMLKAYAAIKAAFGSSVNEKDVKMIFGNPDKEYDNFTTLPNDPKKYGTVEEGILYNYKERDFKGLEAFVLWDSNLGGTSDRKVPQAKGYNNGINPATGKSYVQGSHMHAAIYDVIKDDYDSGSRGCIVRYGGFSEFNAYLSNPKRNTGRVIIFR